MKMLEGKTALVFGIANDHSIAWGIARALHAHGAQIAVSYASDPFERRVRPLAEQLGSTFVEKCDVTDDAQIERLFGRLNDHVPKIDILVHAIAFAPRADMTGEFLNTSRDGFRIAMDVSVYSLVALARAAVPSMADGGSIMTLSYYGGEKVAPGYRVMGPAKAALESSARYLAAELGPRGIRVNVISPGPIRTLAAAGVPGFKDAHAQFAESAPLRRHIDIDDVGTSAVWLASEMSRNVTGQTLFVDGGHNILLPGAE